VWAGGGGGGLSSSSSSSSSSSVSEMLSTYSGPGLRFSRPPLPGRPWPGGLRGARRGGLPPPQPRPRSWAVGECGGGQVRDYRVRAVLQWGQRHEGNEGHLYGALPTQRARAARGARDSTKRRARGRDRGARRARAAAHAGIQPALAAAEPGVVLRNREGAAWVRRLFPHIQDATSCKAHGMDGPGAPPR
jgi:hypothetical protein